MRVCDGPNRCALVDPRLRHLVERRVAAGGMSARTGRTERGDLFVDERAKRRALGGLAVCLLRNERIAAPGRIGLTRGKGRMSRPASSSSRASERRASATPWPRSAASITMLESVIVTSRRSDVTSLMPRASNQVCKAPSSSSVRMTKRPRSVGVRRRARPRSCGEQTTTHASS